MNFQLKKTRKYNPFLHPEAHQEIHRIMLSRNLAPRVPPWLLG